MAVVRQHLFAAGLVAVEVIAQVGDRAPRREPWRPLRQPPRAGSQFAVLFGVTILRRDERGGQREHRRLARRDQGRGDGGMEMPDLAVGQGAYGAVGARNRVRGEVLRPIQRDREAAGERAVGVSSAPRRASPSTMSSNSGASSAGGTGSSRLRIC